MLVDSHSHLAHPYLKNDVDLIVKSALENGVTKIVTIGCNINEARDSLAIAEKYADVVYSTAGLYPRDSKEDFGSDLSLLDKLKIIEEIANNDKIVAIG